MYRVSVIERNGRPEKIEWPKTAELLADATISVAYGVAVKLGLMLTVGDHPVSLMWPANAVLLGALLLRPSNQWGLLLLAVLPAHLIVESGGGIPFSMVLSWYLSNCCEALLGATAIRACMGGPKRRDSFRWICAFFVCGGFLGPVVSSFIDAAFVRLNHWGSDPFWTVWRQRTLSNIFAASTVGVAILTCGHAIKCKVSPKRLVEGGLLSLGLASAVLLALSRSSTWQADLGGAFWLYAPWPFLLWAALRFGPAGASGALLMVSSLTIWRVFTSHRPFLAVDEQTVRLVQLFFLAHSFTLVPLAAALSDRQRTEAELRTSETRYRGIVETQPDLVCRTLADTTLSFVNKAFCKLFARSEEQLLGRKYLDFISPDQHLATLSHIATVFTSRQNLTVEQEIRLPDGSIGWQQWVHHPIVNEDGWIREVQSIGRDITRSKATETALRETEAKNAAMLAALPDTLVLVDREGVILDCRNQDEFLLRLPPDKCLGRKAPDVLPAQMAEELRVGFAVDLPPGKSKTKEIALLIDGAEHVYEMRIVVCGPERLLCLAREITEQKRAAQVWANMIHASRLAVIGEFTAIVGHEVSQPLAAILINVQTIRRLAEQPHPPIPEVLAALDEVQQDVGRARDTVSRLRALTQRRAVEMRSADINNLLEEVLRLAAGDAQRRQVQLRKELDPSLPPVRVDPVLIEHVLLNLVFNGMEAMQGRPAPERVLTVKTKPVPNESRILISVTDRGCGIPPDVLPCLFSSFYSTKETGVGLGLSVARTLVQAHHGRIWAENNCDRGATFHFYLPAEFNAVSTVERKVPLRSE